MTPVIINKIINTFNKMNNLIHNINTIKMLIETIINTI